MNLLFLFITFGVLNFNLQQENLGLKNEFRQFDLKETTASLQPGDYYLTSEINYYFSGNGDENSMDETPFINESSISTLDSIAVFLKRESRIHCTIYFISNDLRTFDSCVECSFEKKIKDYLVSKGVNTDRIECSFSKKSSKDSGEYVNKVKSLESKLTTSSRNLLLVIDSIH